MLKITILCIGKIKEKYLQTGIDEFQKRLRPFAQINIVERKEERMPAEPSLAEKLNVLEKEGNILLPLIPPASYVFVLDVAGKMLSSEQLAQKLETIPLQGKSEITFIIGGPFGISEIIRKRADFRLSFSPMTFTHQMIRLLLLEQLYRAEKINHHEKYHL